MTIEVDLEDINRISSFGAQNLESPTHIDDMEEEEASIIRKTMAQISNLPLLTQLSDANSLDGRVTIGAPVSPTITQCAEELSTYEEQVEQIANQEILPLEFPHLAWEAIKAGLAKENFIHEQLNRYIDEIQNAHGDISLLLDLNAELGAVKEENSEFSERAQNLLEQLRGRGIDLQGETIGDIKRLAGSHESRLRSEIQIKFTTKVQYLMQQIESMNQILQNIIRNDSKLKEKANQLPR